VVTFNFTPWEGAPGIHRTGDWVGLGAGLDVLEKKKFSCLCQELKQCWFQFSAINYFCLVGFSDYIDNMLHM